MPLAVAHREVFESEMTAARSKLVFLKWRYHTCPNLFSYLCLEIAGAGLLFSVMAV